MACLGLSRIECHCCHKMPVQLALIHCIFGSMTRTLTTDFRIYDSVCAHIYFSVISATSDIRFVIQMVTNSKISGKLVINLAE